MDEPGWGERVSLSERNGYQVEVTHGRQTLSPITIDIQEVNSTKVPLNGKGELMRIPAGLSRLHRIGHMVMGSLNIEESVQWFRATLGMVGSDNIYAGDKSNLIGSSTDWTGATTMSFTKPFFASSRRLQGSNIFNKKFKTLTTSSRAMRIWPRSTSTSTCGGTLLRKIHHTNLPSTALKLHSDSDK
jgi:hypothetical protein